MSPERLAMPSRRLVLRSLAGLALGLPAARALSADGMRIASLDYGLASTLLSLGVTPVAVSTLADWDRWVVEPAMPSGVHDLGSTFEVNLEMLAMLKPDLILTTPYLDGLLHQLEGFAPVLRLSVYAPDGGPILPAAIAATRQLGAAIGRDREAGSFLERADAFFEDCHERIARHAAPPLALVSFMDARHARIYGAPGLYHNVLERIGVRNAWSEPSNYWGFQTIALEELVRVSDPDARLIAFEPVPGDVRAKLATSPIWQALPFARPGHFSVLPPALMFGMVNEAMRFADLVAHLLERDI
jgi:iron complex transport system substrate-binding protein